MRWEAVVAAVPREEGHAPPADIADRQRIAGWPEGRFDLDGLRRLEQRVEPGTPDDADLSARAVVRRSGRDRHGARQ